MEDEAYFIHNVRSGRKYWSRKGERINASYTGSHKKIAVYGSLASDDRQFFWTYEGFNVATFVTYLKELQQRFGKVLVITDRASPHNSKLVREFLHDNKNIKIMYLPKGSPYLNIVEECWRQGKRALVVSEHYRMFSYMWQVISTYYTIPSRIDQIGELN